MNFSGVCFASYCVLLLVLTTLAKFGEAKKIKSVDDCEVCVKYIQRFDESLKAHVRKDINKIKMAFIEDCKNRKGKDERFCYYVGGLETSATGLILEVARPLSHYIPAFKICEKLSSRDDQICELKYEKKIDLTNANFKKMKVKNLKKILSDWGEDCRGCTEKSDYIHQILEFLPIHEPEVYRARAKLEL